MLNDPGTLHSTLNWGKENNLTPATGGEACQDGDNPILVSCQQDFKTCMGHLYHHGYRMKKENEESKEDYEDYEDDDQVKQFRRFFAKSNIHYLSLELTEHPALKKNTAPSPKEIKSLQDVDPIRKVFHLMDNADQNMEDFQGSSELKDNYDDIKKNLEDFSGSILTQCRGLKEVKTILDHNPEDDDDDELDDAETNWQVALFNGYKNLVSHPNFQQYLWRKMTNEGSVNTKIPLKSITDKIPNLKPSTKTGIGRALWNIKNIPLTILTFFCYPFVVLADLCRKGDILFVKPKVLEKRLMNNSIEEQKVDEEGCFNYFRTRMHIPMLRMIPYVSIQILYRILLLVSIWNSLDPVKADFTENKMLWATISIFVTFIIAINFLIDDIIDLFRAHYFQSFWNSFSLLTHLLLVGGAVIARISYSLEPNGTNMADLSGNNAVNVGRVMLSFGAGMEFFRILQWLVLLETTGPIVLCVIQVIKDALRMVSIYVILFISHSIAFWSLYKPFRQENDQTKLTPDPTYTLSGSADALKSQRGLVSTLFWRIIASADGEMVHIKKSGSEVPFSLEFSHLMGYVLWVFYQIIIYILMLNLLIAIMNTSYSELWQNAKKEWKYSKSFFQV